MNYDVDVINKFVEISKSIELFYGYIDISEETSLLNIVIY